MGGTGSRTLARVVAWSFTAAVFAAACGGGGDSSSDSSSTSTARRNTDVAASFGDAPPLVVSAPLSLAKVPPSEFFLPVGYLESPTATKATMTDAPGRGGDGVVAPNGEHAAKARIEPSGKSGAVEIFDVMTGRRIEAVEFAGPALTRPVDWAPNGSGLVFADEDTWYLHQVEGPTVEYDRSTQLLSRLGIGAFTSDPESVAVISCNMRGEITRISSADTDGAPDAFAVGDLCGVTQLTGNDGTPVVLASGGPDLYIVGTTGDPRKVYSTGASADAALTFTPCDGLAVVRSDEPIGATEEPYFVFEVSSGRTVPLPAGVALGSRISCPIASPDRSKIVVGQEDGPVLVVDVATGASVEVHPEGRPISWSAAGADILVTADGLYVVNADGSNTEELSLELSTSGGSAGYYCRGGDSGMALLRVQLPSKVQGDPGFPGVVMYSVGQNFSFRTDATQLEATCSTTLDNKWILSGTLLLNVEEPEGALLPIVNSETGAREDGPGVNDHRWYGSQRTLVAAGFGRSSS